MINYNNKVFVPIKNSANGEVTEDMRFKYSQNGNILHCTYSGKQILLGQLIGLVSVNGVIDMRYQQINIDNQISTGVCISTPTILEDGRIRLTEKWKWTSGDYSTGTSILEEL